MATKLKGWTAVKIICFILILILSFTILNRILAVFVRAEVTGVNPNIVLMDASSNQYFHETHMNSAIYNASVLAYFGSEAAIRAGMHLQWVESSYGMGYTDDFGNHDFFVEHWMELWTPDRVFYYDRISAPDINISRYRRVFEENAIQQQLDTFRNAYSALINMEGLIYHIEGEVEYIYDSFFGVTAFPELYDSEVEGVLRGVFGEEFELSGVRHRYSTETDSFPIFISNKPGQATESYFKEFPVFYLATAGEQPQQSDGTRYFYEYGEGLYNNPVTIFLAFDYNTVHEQNRIYAAVSSAYTLDMSIIAVSAIFVLGLIVVLLVGAGRKSIVVEGKLVRAEGVHFSPADKPYLDLSLAVLVLWSVFLALAGFHIIDNIVYIGVQTASWHAGAITLINITFAAAVLLIVTPALIWLMSFSKRLKAGRFWKHTLIYAIVCNVLFSFLRYCFRCIKSLWAGTKLTLRVAVISTAAFFVMFITGLIGAETRGAGPIILVSLFFTATATVLLLHYARRIRGLEQGARAASEGDYETPIEAGGGELGSIAGAINNISSGINIAVEQRMKSERLKTELITNVSHDIRTPLTSIITYTDLLDHEGLDCEKAPEYLEILKLKSQRLKTLTDELFEAAKAATGNIDVNLTELNVVSLINQVLGELDNAVKTSGLDLRVNLPDKLYARADGRLMQRVLENLMSNVFKYSMPGSRVYLDVLAADNSQVMIAVKNISSQELNFDPSELTERFKRGDDSRADGGSGLGLSIVQSFVDAQGGTFNVSIDGDLFKATVLLPGPPEKGVGQTL